MEPTTTPPITTSTPTASPAPKGSSPLSTILGFLTLALLATSVFLFLQNQQLRQQLTSTPVPTPTPTIEIDLTPTASPSGTQVATSSSLPIIHSPKANALVKSPLKVTGTVPAGWMFEGSFPIYLTHPNGTAIGNETFTATETKPGSWQTDDPINFTATLTFTTDVTLGYIVLDKANPSGLPENKISFRLPVRFK